MVNPYFCLIVFLLRNASPKEDAFFFLTLCIPRHLLLVIINSLFGLVLGGNIAILTVFCLTKKELNNVYLIPQSVIWDHCQYYLLHRIVLACHINIQFIGNRWIKIAAEEKSVSKRDFLSQVQSFFLGYSFRYLKRWEQLWQPFSNMNSQYLWLVYVLYSLSFIYDHFFTFLNFLLLCLFLANF